MTTINDTMILAQALANYEVHEIDGWDEEITITDAPSHLALVAIENTEERPDE